MGGGMGGGMGGMGGMFGHSDHGASKKMHTIMKAMGGMNGGVFHHRGHPRPNPASVVENTVDDSSSYHRSLVNKLRGLDQLHRNEARMGGGEIFDALMGIEHTMLSRISCITGCMHHKNEHGRCYEQSCAFHYVPSMSRRGETPIACADEITIMALTEEAEGNVQFAIHPYAIEPEDDMSPTELYASMDNKYKYSKRLKNGDLQQAAITKVCHDISCADHPPPMPINAGDTVYTTVVAYDENGEFKHLHPGSYRIVVIGSETGKSCQNGGKRTLGPLGLRRL